MKRLSRKKKRLLIDEVLDILKTACSTCIVVILTYTFIGRIAWVSGQSMEPTLFDRDVLLVWALGYDPSPGDIIACNSEGLGKVIVKRVVATAGQEVTIDFGAGKVYVDGEEFIVDGIENITTLSEGREIEKLVVPADCCFVLGDNRQHSTDSRNPTVGFVSCDDIIGRAILRILPLDSIRKL